VTQQKDGGGGVSGAGEGGGGGVPVPVKGGIVAGRGVDTIPPRFVYRLARRSCRRVVFERRFVLLTCIRLAAFGVAVSVASVAHAGVFVFTGDHATASVNPNVTQGQFSTEFDLPSLPAVNYGMPVTSDVEAKWSGSASTSGSAVVSLFTDLKRNFTASAGASAEAWGRHGNLKALASASADVQAGMQVFEYMGQPVAMHSPLSAGATGSIQVGYNDTVTVLNPSLGSNEWVTLKGKLHLHAGFSMDNASMAGGLAETVLNVYGTYAKLEGSNSFNTGEIALARHFSQGTWLKDDQHDVEFTIEVLNGVSFSIMQTLRVVATAGAVFNSDHSSSVVNAMNTATLEFTPIGEGTQVQTVSGATYLVPEPGCLGLMVAAAGLVARRRR
jgi:hypothetical protein